MYGEKLNDAEGELTGCVIKEKCARVRHFIRHFSELAVFDEFSSIPINQVLPMDCGW